MDDGIMYRGRRRLRGTEATERLRSLLGQDEQAPEPRREAPCSLSDEVFEQAPGVAPDEDAEPGHGGVTDHPFLSRRVRPRPEEPVARHREQATVRSRVARPAFVLLALLLAVAAVMGAVSLVPGGEQAGTEVAGAETSPGTGPQDPQAAGSSAAANPGTPGASAPPAAPGAAAAGAATGTGPLTVHVVGEVEKPSVVEVPAGSRVIDAVEAAGGLTPHAVTEHVNLALTVTDGQQVVIPDRKNAQALAAGAGAGGQAGRGGAGSSSPAEAPAGGSQGGRAAGASPVSGAPGTGAGSVNLNTAGADELQTLPRVGPVTAQRIVDFRTQHGPFTSPEQLDDVTGIGPAMLEALLPLVSV